MGMLLVNFIGGYQQAHPLLKHHNTYCSYADTIMPQFFFAVGVSLRLSLLRRRAREGPGAALGHALERVVLLMLIGLAFYHLDGGFKQWKETTGVDWLSVLGQAFQKSYFQTLVHIAVATLWVLPVVWASRRTLLLYAVGSAVLHVVLSKAFYYDWLWRVGVIDGGPMGFLSWSLPVIAGMLTYDALHERGPMACLRWLLGWGAVLMVLGYMLSCLDSVDGQTHLAGRIAGQTAEASSTVTGSRQWGWAAPPFFEPVWTPGFWSMSQRAGSVSYQIFASGFSMWIFAVFVAWCDLGKCRLAVFHWYGVNALAAYLVHGEVAAVVKPFVPRDAPAVAAVAALLVYFLLNTYFVRFLDRNSIHLKL